MAKLEREQVQTLDQELNNIYDGYKGTVQCMRKLTGLGFNQNAYTIELSEEQEEEIRALVSDQLSKIEKAVENVRNLLAKCGIHARVGRPIPPRETQPKKNRGEVKTHGIL